MADLWQRCSAFDQILRKLALIKKEDKLRVLCGTVGSQKFKKGECFIILLFGRGRLALQTSSEHKKGHRVPSERMCSFRKVAWRARCYASNKKVGQTRGLEPPNTGTTIRGLNHLATPATFAKTAFPGRSSQQPILSRAQTPCD